VPRARAPSCPRVCGRGPRHAPRVSRLRRGPPPAPRVSPLERWAFQTAARLPKWTAGRSIRRRMGSVGPLGVPSRGSWRQLEHWTFHGPRGGGVLARGPWRAFRRTMAVRRQGAVEGLGAVRPLGPRLTAGRSKQRRNCPRGTGGVPYGDGRAQWERWAFHPGANGVTWNAGRSPGDEGANPGDDGMLEARRGGEGAIPGDDGTLEARRGGDPRRRWDVGGAIPGPDERRTATNHENPCAATPRRDPRPRTAAGSAGSPR
jgi:hypothetical protein